MSPSRRKTEQPLKDAKLTFKESLNKEQTGYLKTDTYKVPKLDANKVATFQEFLTSETFHWNFWK